MNKRDVVRELQAMLHAGATNAAFLLGYLLPGSKAERRRRAMRKSAELRRCPACGRSSALHEVAIDGAMVLRCRWCDWEAKRI